ncbi:uncharacterized protein LOC106074337 [Biomphalaria glabrata]|uniref:Uncharacterized protein LOC106074337 n=1 Tax=Biomphalaria glabrata TaxID=6526 RepID=A0A9W2YP01_BIOGL|nr:uncharacterized protein LOC106074337 [Biomphalaria glabrata]XP_055864495.1 uncharacterized protein LOC106074337 [Biomphalaria glabrata]XP_055864496.1 uncharacterized protein LOC106074337 [Biomphalaria glabrata]XP_055864498.1 uncharacterized protein LOC106074337 [Biomphalaria glabrata]XP_055864499.1 uncharacterized protein LOC106074337 [Biomphalaria glabrata]
MRHYILLAVLLCSYLDTSLTETAKSLSDTPTASAKEISITNIEQQATKADSPGASGSASGKSYFQNADAHSEIEPALGDASDIGDESQLDSIPGRSGFNAYGIVDPNAITEEESGVSNTQPGEMWTIPLTLWIPEDSTKNGEVPTNDNPVDDYLDSKESSQENVDKRPFDRIGTSSFTSFGKRPFDRIGTSSFTSFGKRPFDRIGTSAFTSFGKRPFDRIGNSAFASFGKRPFDRIGNSAFASFGKRPFDRIGNSAFTSFGKRPFDRIGNSAFTSFGKRPFDRIGNSAFTTFGKRPFDRIGTSAFTSFGKRPFDRIGNSAFTTFGKRPFDRIGSSAFTSFGKRPFDRIGTSAITSFGKRPFDRIGNSAFTTFGKRPFDRIGSSAFTSFGKRPFDRIGTSSFTSFGKREDEEGAENFEVTSVNHLEDAGNAKMKEASNKGNSSLRKKRALESNSKTERKEAAIVKREAEKRTAEGELTLSMVANNADLSGPISKRFSGTFNRLDNEGDDNSNEISSDKLDEFLNKRRFDSISDSSAFNRFGKRRFDRISKNSQFNPFGKRRFDRISSISGFGKFGKRKFDSIADGSRFSSFGKRRFDRISSGFSHFGKRRFDRIDRGSAFSRFGKRNYPFNLGKSSFDRIDKNSAFNAFGKRDWEPVMIDENMLEPTYSQDLDLVPENSRSFSKPFKVLIDSPWPEQHINNANEGLGYHDDEAEKGLTDMDESSDEEAKQLVKYLLNL